MGGSPAWTRRWRVPVAIAALLALLQAAASQDALEYRRTAVLHGEVWRLVTGNLVHLGWAHLARDVAGLFLIWGLLGESLDERGWGCAALVSGLAVGLGLLAFSPEIAWYVGISGVLFGLFSAGALAQFQERPTYAAALLLGMAAVIAWSLIAGALPWETAGLGGAVVPQAHLYGALGGAVFMAVRVALRRRAASTGWGSGGRAFRHRGNPGIALDTIERSSAPSGERQPDSESSRPRRPLGPGATPPG